jgi:hypothetical protein
MGFRTWKPGASVKRVRPGVFVSQSQDIARAFDFIAWNESEVHLIQSKSPGSNESHASEARKLIDSVGMDPTVVVQRVMMRVKRYTFVVWTRQHDGSWKRNGTFTKGDVIDV